MDKVESLLEAFFENEGIKESNTILREKTVKGEFIASRNSLNELMSKILEYAEEGLLKRGKGEEKLLAPLYRRCMLLSCPGRVAYRYNEDDIVTMYGYY